MPCVTYPTPEEEREHARREQQRLAKVLGNVFEDENRKLLAENSELKEKLAWFEAALCMVTSSVESIYYDLSGGGTDTTVVKFHDPSVLDYKEAGISRNSFMKWWKQHKAKDALRREEEKKMLEQKEARDAALQKLKSSLTEDEIKLLNIPL